MNAEQEMALLRDKWDEMGLNQNGPGDRLLTKTMTECQTLGKTRVEAAIIIIDTLVVEVNRLSKGGEV